MRNVWAFSWGTVIGILGGLIGLGGAEFRLPVLVSVFEYRILHAVIINLVVSLVTVVFSLIFRAKFFSLDLIPAYGAVIINILAGSLIGSFAGVHFATKINEHLLKRIVVILLVCLSVVLVGHDLILANRVLLFPPAVRVVLGFTAGAFIGLFSSMLGVAGGELIIPTIILLFAVDIKLAGNLSLAISIPTIIVGIWRYRTRQSFRELRPQTPVILFLSLGSIAGARVGSYLLQYVTGSFLHLFLGLILLLSAIKLSRETSAKVALQ